MYIALHAVFLVFMRISLYSHEKKKMYWEQLESRRRLLYRRPYTLQSPSIGGDGEGDGSSGALPASECACCTDDYGFPTHPSGEALYPYALWDTLDDRYSPSGR